MITDVDELEPLFEYSRVQPRISAPIDDDSQPALYKPRRFSSAPICPNSSEVKVVDLDSSEDEEEDWLPPPPLAKGPTTITDVGDNSIIQKLRLKKKELEVSFSTLLDEEGEKILEESVNAMPCIPQKKPTTIERPKIFISLQDKNGIKSFRIYKDETFEKLLKIYAEKTRTDIDMLTFIFDGDRVGPTDTPNSLQMEDEDLLEVIVKSR